MNIWLEIVTTNMKEVLQSSLPNRRRTKRIHALSQWHKESDMSDTELLQAILSKVEGLEKALTKREQYRIGPKEFAIRMNISERTLWTRINDGVIKKPFKDGPKRYWLSGYVNEVVVNNESSQ